jgi:hypothetical protein
MTQPLQDPPSAPVVRPEEGTRLDALAAQYAVLKPKLDELTELLKTVTDAIKAEMALATGSAPRATLASPHLPGYLLQSAYRESWRLDTKRLKAQHPLIYATLAKKSGSWRLDQVQG